MANLKSILDRIVNEEIDRLKGGKADKMSVKDIAKKHNVPVSLINKEIKKGTKVEKEHTKNKKVAKEIAKDHEVEMPDYYTELDKMEKKSKK